MTPADLAAYIARGVSALPAFDLPAILDALRAERVTARPDRHRRIDEAIAAIEHCLNPGAVANTSETSC